MKKILLIPLLLSTLLLSGCSLNSANKDIEQSKIVDEVSTRGDVLKKELVSKYNPVVFDDWRFKFTKDIQDASDKDFLLQGEVRDLYEKDGKYFIKFDPLFSSSYFGTFEINSDQLDFIKNNFNKDEFFNEMFAVVKIDKVSKPIFSIDGSIDTDVVTIDAVSSESFLLSGSLVELQKIPSSKK